MKKQINKQKSNKIEYKYLVLVFLVILTVILGIFSFVLKEDRNLNPIESVLKDGFSLVQRVVYKPFKYIGEKINDRKEKKNIYEKYEKILLDKEKYELIKTENIELKRQIEALKSELNVETVPTDYQKVNATVINRNVGYWYNTLTIDKGEKQNITVGMIVINNRGLIGKVIKTTNLTSTVKLITTSDINNKLSILVETNEGPIHGLLSSYDYKNNYLLIEGISNTVDVDKDNRVYTSGYGGVYPSGILIGYVEATNSDVYDLTKFVKVKPSVDFGNINYVTVLKKEVSE